MARNDDYSESDPTQYANYGGTGGEAYSEYDSPAYSTGPTGYGQTPPPPRRPWHQKPAVLVALGVLSAAILALLVFAVVKFVGSDSSTPAGTTSTSSVTTSSAAPAPATTESPSEPSTTQSAAPAPAPTTQTVTVSPTETPTTTVAPTTTTTAAPVTTTTVAPTPSTTTSISTSVTTVTETTTKRLWPTIPTFAPPTLYQPPGQ
ncbi:MAG: hypothetical protein ACOYBX_06180 [Mycobacterium sp.]